MPQLPLDKRHLVVGRSVKWEYVWSCERPRSRQKKRVYLRKQATGVYVHMNTHMHTHACTPAHARTHVGICTLMWVLCYPPSFPIMSSLLTELCRALGPSHTCWRCCRETGPLPSGGPWPDSLGSRRSFTTGPTPPPSVSRSSAEGICRSRGFSLGLAGLWGGEMAG